MESKEQEPQSFVNFHWMGKLDERMRKHVMFAKNYAEQYAHGAPGHLDLMTIAALAKLLDEETR